MRLWFALIVFLAPAVSAARPTVGIAPFHATSSDGGYAWLGSALSRSLAARVHDHPELNSLTVRQVNAAIRAQGIDTSKLDALAAAVAVGRELGADLLVTGTCEVGARKVVLEITLVGPEKAERIATRTLRLPVSRLAEIETVVTGLIASHAKVSQFAAATRALGDVRDAAWANEAMAMGILDRQSLSPPAAEIDAPRQITELELGRAVAHLNEAIEIDPNRGEVWVGVAITSALVHETLAAERALDRAAELGVGDRPTAVLARAFMLIRDGRYQTAVGVLSEAIHRDRGFLHALGTLGELYLHMGHYKSARVIFNAYALAVPRNPWVLVQRGRAAAKLGDHTSAVADTRRAAELQPGAVYLQRALVQRYLDAGSLGDARVVLARALAAHPADDSLLALASKLRTRN